MKEIGGYFGMDELKGDEYYKDLIPLNTGRNALLYLMKAKSIKKLYIPHYLCETVRDLLYREGYPFEYYHVDGKFLPLFSKELKEGEYLYVVNLFGQISNSRIEQFKNKMVGRIIVDNSHAFFQPPLGSVDTIYSCRKFFGVPDGAYLATDAKLEEELDEDVSKERMSYILGRFEGSAAEYYESFQENNLIFDFEPLKQMSRLTGNLLKAIDYEKTRETRNTNYAFLATELDELNPLALSRPEGPFAYPFYTDKGPDIRKELAKLKIYIPTLWPNVLAEMPKDTLEYQYAANILPLPCDQRYGKEEMAFVAEMLKQQIAEKVGTSF